jgi:PHP family Zn ribbon phosphoesterase
MRQTRPFYLPAKGRMKIVVEAGHGKFNPEYKVVLAKPEMGDYHYRPGSYCPKHQELYDMIRLLLSCEPQSKRDVLTKGFLQAIEEGNKMACENPDKTNPEKNRAYLPTKPLFIECAETVF